MQGKIGRKNTYGGVFVMNEQKELYEQLINEELKYCSVEDLKFFYCLIAENNIKYENKIEEKVS